MSLHLEDIELIKRLKYTYCRSIDTCDIDLLSSLLTEDISVDYQGGSYRFQASGREEVLAAIRAAFHSEAVSTHTVHHPIIDVHEDGTADGHWTLIDHFLDLRNRVATDGCSFYVDKYVKQNGKWLIQRATYTRLFERVEPVVGQPNLTAHLLARTAAS
jgi:hypothetical protein